MRYLTPWDAYRVQKKSFKEELEQLQKAHGALVLDRCLDVVKAHFAKCEPGDMRDLDSGQSIIFHEDETRELRTTVDGVTQILRSTPDGRVQEYRG